MGRTWVRKTLTHGKFDAECMKSAVQEVLKGRSIRDVAREFELKKSTLCRYVTAKRGEDTGDQGFIQACFWRGNSSPESEFPPEILANH